MLFDDTSNRQLGADADGEINRTDKVLFSDDNDSRQGPGPKADPASQHSKPENPEPDRKSLIAKAKSRINKAKTTNQMKPEGSATSGKKPQHQAMRGPMAGQEDVQGDEAVEAKKKRGLLASIKDLSKQIKKTEGEQEDSSGPSMQSLKDPRKMAADLADQYLHLGKKLGLLLFLIWEGSFAIGSIPLVITGIPGLIMANLLLVSPKLCYRITVWLLLLIPGVGEAVEAVDKVGLGKVHITVTPLQKIAIVITDLIWVIAVLVIFSFILSIFCWSVSDVSGFVAANVANLWYGTSLFTEMRQYCQGVQ